MRLKSIELSGFKSFAKKTPLEFASAITSVVGPNGSGKTTFYRGKGCGACLKTGYKGRIGLIEVLALTPKIKALILEGSQEYKIREEARREGMQTLRENGMRNALDGLTTPDEIIRVTVGDQDLGMGKV